jgi:hypothetical protein
MEKKVGLTTLCLKRPSVMAARRVRRYKRKYRTDPTVLRAKVLLPQMAPRMEEALKDLEKQEQISFEGFSQLLIPQNQADYYLAYCKRLYKLCITFEGATLLTEIENLINEFEARGLNRNMLLDLRQYIFQRAYEHRGQLTPVLIRFPATWEAYNLDLTLQTEASILPPPAFYPTIIVSASMCVAYIFEPSIQISVSV